MQTFFNYLLTWGSKPMAVAIVAIVILALFLVPMYVTHCTGRRISKHAFSKYAKVHLAREWLIGRISVLYIVHATRLQAGISRWQDNEYGVIEFRLGRLSFSLTLVPRPQIRIVRQTYRYAVGKPAYSWWERHVRKHHQGY